MGDLFGDWVPREWIEAILETVCECPWHTFLFLTKNPKRYQEFEFPGNAWIGTTVEAPEYEWRIPLLLEAYASTYWVSIEPILGAVDLMPYLGPSWGCPECGDMSGFPGEHCVGCSQGVYVEGASIDWIVVGCQTGVGAKPPAREWIKNLIDQCRTMNIPLWVKRPLYDEFPIQELPATKEEQCATIR
jgi:protein gp37